MPNFSNVNELGQNGTTNADNHLNGGNVLMNGSKNDSGIEANSTNSVTCVEIKSNVDREIIRLIGQHLRGLGLKYVCRRLLLK